MEALLFFALILLVGQLGVGLGYHRYLAHKSFEPRRPLELLMVFLGLPAGTPVQWAGNHRYHHIHEDTEKDPHSPHHGGFWHAHNGWYLGTRNPLICVLYGVAGPLRALFDAFWRPRTNLQHAGLARDVASDPILALWSKPWVFTPLVLFHTALILGSSFLLLGWSGLATAFLTYVVIYNLGDGVDSFGHLYGNRAGRSSGQARDNALIAFFTFGEGWHASHHAAPLSARHGRQPGQIDANFLVIKALQRTGLVRRVHEE